MVHFLPLYFNYNKSNMSKKSEDQTSSDAIHVATIMLDPKHHGSVGGFLKGVKNRAKQDQSIQTPMLDGPNRHYLIPMTQHMKVNNPKE